MGEAMRILAVACLAMAVSGAQPATVEGTWRADYDNYWTRDGNERWVSIQLRREGEFGNSGLGIPGREVPPLNDRGAQGPIHFTLRRDAGSFVFDGTAANGRASGDFRF